MKTARQTRLSRRIRKEKKAIEKKPNNMALTGMYIFFNLVALLFDLLAATTVMKMTGGNILYGILTFSAGFIPLVLHEAGYIRAAANPHQKKITIGGIIVSVLTILGTSLLIDVLNLSDIANMSAAYVAATEKTIMWTLRIIAIAHSIAAGFYFYLDTGIQRKHRREQARAEAEDELKEIKLAGEITAETTKVLVEEDRILSTLGGDNDALAAALARIKGSPLYVEKEDEEKPIPVTFEAAAEMVKGEGESAESFPE